MQQNYAIVGWWSKRAVQVLQVLVTLKMIQDEMYRFIFLKLFKYGNFHIKTILLKKNTLQ